MALVQDLLGRIRQILRDADSDAWTDDQILDAIHEAELVTVNHRPDATSTFGDVTLAPGTLQSLSGLDPPAARLLDVLANVVDGNLGYALRRVQRTDLDARFPMWHAAASRAEIWEWCFDDRAPNTFMVNPPAPALETAGIPNTPLVLRVLYSALPAPYPRPLPADQETTVGPLYAPALPEWALYRLFGEDIENSVNLSRANAHLQVFGNLIGVQLDAALRFSPKRRENNAQ